MIHWTSTEISGSKIEDQTRYSLTNKDQVATVILHHLTQWKIIRSVISNKKYTERHRERKREKRKQKEKRKEKGEEKKKREATNLSSTYNHITWRNNEATRYSPSLVHVICQVGEESRRWGEEGKRKRAAGSRRIFSACTSLELG